MATPLGSIREDSSDVAADAYASVHIVPAIHNALTKILDDMPETDHATEFVRYLRENGERQRDVIYSTAEPKVVEAFVPLDALAGSRSEHYKSQLAACAGNDVEEVNNKFGITIQLLPRGKRPRKAERVTSGGTSARNTPGSQALSPPLSQTEISVEPLTPSKTGKTVKYSLPSSTEQHAAIAIPTFVVKESPLRPSAAIKPSELPNEGTDFALPSCCTQSGNLPLYGLYCPNKEDLENTFLYLRHVSRVTKNISLLFLLQNETVFIDKVPYAGNKWRHTCQQYGINIPFRPFEEAVQSAVLDERMSTEGRSVAHHDCDTLDDIVESLELRAGVTSTSLQRIYCPDLSEYPHTLLQFSFIHLLNEIIFNSVVPHAPDSAVIVADFSSNRMGLGLVQSCLATALSPFEERFRAFEVYRELLQTAADSDEDMERDSQESSRRSMATATSAHEDTLKTLDFNQIRQKHVELVARREQRDSHRKTVIAQYRRDLLTPDQTQEQLAKVHSKIAAMQQIILSKAGRRQSKDESFAVAHSKSNNFASVVIQAQMRARLGRKGFTSRRVNGDASQQLEDSKRMLKALTPQPILQKHFDANVDSDLGADVEQRKVRVRDERYNCKGHGALYAPMRLAVRELLETYPDHLCWDPTYQPLIRTSKSVEWKWRTVRIKKEGPDDVESEDEVLECRELCKLTAAAKVSATITTDLRYPQTSEETMHVNIVRKGPHRSDPYRTALNLMRGSSCDLTGHLSDLSTNYEGCYGMQARGYKLLKGMIHLVFNSAFMALRSRGHPAVSGKGVEQWLASCHNRLLVMLQSQHLVAMCVPKDSPPEVLKAGPCNITVSGGDWTVVSAATLPQKASLPWRVTRNITATPISARGKSKDVSLTFLTAGNLTARSEIGGSDFLNANYITDEAKSSETAACGYSFFHHDIPIFAFYEPMDTKAMREMAQRVAWYTGCTWISTSRNLVVYVNDSPFAFVNRCPYPSVILPPLAKVTVKEQPVAASPLAGTAKDPKAVVNSPNSLSTTLLSPKPPQERLARLASIRLQANGQPTSPEARLSASGSLTRKSSEIRSSSSLRRRQRKSGNEDAQVVEDINMLSLGAAEAPQCDTNIPTDELKWMDCVSWHEAERCAAVALKTSGDPATGKVSVYQQNGCGDVRRRGAGTLEGCNLTPTSVQVFDPVAFAAAKEAERLKLSTNQRPVDASLHRSSNGDINIPLYVQPVRRRSKPEVMFVGETRAAVEEQSMLLDPDAAAASLSGVGAALSPQAPSTGKPSSARSGSFLGPHAHSEASYSPPKLEGLGTKSSEIITVRSYSDACKDHILRRHPLEGTFSRVPTHLGTQNMINSISAIAAKTDKAMRSASIGIGIDTPDNLPLLATALIAWCVKHEMCETIIEEINEQLSLADRHLQYGDGDEGESVRARSVGSSSTIVHIFNLRKDGSLANASQDDLTTLRSGGRSTVPYTVMTNAPPELRPLPLIDSIQENYALEIAASGADLNESRAFIDSLLLRTNLSAPIRSPIVEMTTFVEEARLGATASTPRERFLLQKRILETTRCTENYLLLLLLHIFLTSKYNGNQRTVERDRKASTSSTASTSSSPKRASGPPPQQEPLIAITFSEFMRSVPFAGQLLKDIDIFVGIKTVTPSHMQRVLCADRDELGVMSGTSSPHAAHLEFASARAKPFLPDPHHSMYDNEWNRWAANDNYVHKII